MKEPIKIIAFPITNKGEGHCLVLLLLRNNMADDEEHTVVEVKQQETVTNGSMGEQEKEVDPKEEPSFGAKAQYRSFISTTDSMKAAARTKVDTIISQVRLVLQSKDGSGTNEEEDVDKKAEGAISLSDEEIELKFVDALCDSVGLKLLWLGL